MNDKELTALWNAHVAQWLEGAPLLNGQFAQWAKGYCGRGRGEVDLDALPEPWIGDLTSRCEALVLGLNPGRAHPEFQHRHGLFANEIRDTYRSYSSWSASSPFLRDPWEQRVGPNVYWRSRRRFLEAWLGRALEAQEVVGFELFPWHSTAVTARMRPDPSIIEEFVFEPARAAGADWAFAFGAPWWDVLDALRLPVIERLGQGGRPYESSTPNRAWIVCDTRSGIRIAAMRQRTTPTPPRAAEVAELRRLLAGE